MYYVGSDAYDDLDASSNSSDDDRFRAPEQQGCCAKIIEYYSEGKNTANPQQKKAWMEVQACLKQIDRLVQNIPLQSSTNGCEESPLLEVSVSLDSRFGQILASLEESISEIKKNNNQWGQAFYEPIEEKWNFDTIIYRYNTLLTINNDENFNDMLGYWVKRLGIALAAAAAGCAAGFKLSAVAAPVLGPWAPVVGGVIGGAVGFFGSRAAALSSEQELYAEINILGEKFSKVEGFNEEKNNKKKVTNDLKYTLLTAEFSSEDEGYTPSGPARFFG